ncbi:MAG: response regulator [Candidatus Riflebacteria bacterium]|nr:response regulator [Candidatus Riflebacteria bacterium]
MPPNNCVQTVLVVDDSPEYLEILEPVLSEEFRLVVAKSGKTALEMVESDPPDLILLDIIMPEMNGYEVCRRLKEKKATQEIPIIFLTAMSGMNDECKGLKLGAIDYISKPFDLDLVTQRVRNHLALRKHNRTFKIIKPS